jgi:hypothetical protein
MILAVDGELALMRAQEDVQNELARVRGDIPAGDVNVEEP